MILSPQSAQTPIGFVDNDSGKPIYMSPPWFRYLTVELYERSGRTDALTNEELGQLAIRAATDRAPNTDAADRAIARGEEFIASERRGGTDALEARLAKIEERIAGDRQQTIDGLRQEIEALRNELIGGR